MRTHMSQRMQLLLVAVLAALAAVYVLPLFASAKTAEPTKNPPHKLVCAFNAHKPGIKSLKPFGCFQPTVRPLSRGVVTAKKTVCTKVMSHGKITNYCKTIDTKAGTDCKHPFKVFYWFAGPAVKGAKKYGSLKVDMIRGGPPDYGRTPQLSWARTSLGVICKIVAKQDGQPEWSSTAQRGTHKLVRIPERLNNGPIPNDLRYVVLWVRKAHKK